MLSTALGLKGLSVPFMSSFSNRFPGISDALMRRDYLREYKNWPFVCIQARSEEVGNIELKLLNNGEEVETHPLLDLLYAVNPAMTKHELFSATQAFKDLDGNAFWYLARDNNGNGKIIEIYPLRPDRVQIIPGKQNPLQVEGYIFTQPDGQKIPFMPQEILHFKTFNPLGNQPFPHRGMGIIEAAAWAIDTDNEARKWNYNFFKNSARPDGILTTAGDASMAPEDYMRLQEEWNSKHQGSENASKVAVLSGGLTWTEISRSQKDMDFGGQRTFSRDEILSIFRVPKTIIGITDDVNRANADASIYVFALRTVKPLMQQMIDTLNEFLVPEFGEGLELVFESPVAEDRKQSLDEYAAGLAQGYLSINEVREAEGLEPVPNGDNLYMPLNMVPVANTEEDISEPEEPATPDDQSTAEETNDPNNADEQKGKGNKKKDSKKKHTKKDAAAPVAEQKKTPAEEAVEKLIASRKSKAKLPESQERRDQKKAKRQLSPEAKDQYIAMYKKNLGINAEPLRKKITSFFTAQEKEVKKNAQQQMKFYSAEQMKGLVEFLFDETEAVNASISLITPFIKQYIETSGKHAADLVGGDFDPETDTLTKFVEKRSQYFADTINGTTKEALLGSIKEGLDNGEDLNQIQDRISTVYEIAKGSRTQMIARTEISAASNQGAIGAYTQAGISQMQWVVVDPSDEDCIENDGVVENIGDPFPSGDTEPPVHPNCECTVVPVFDSAD